MVIEGNPEEKQLFFVKRVLVVQSEDLLSHLGKVGRWLDTSVVTEMLASHNL